MKLRNILLRYLLLGVYHEASSQIVDTLVDVVTCKLHFRIAKGNTNLILFESGGGLTITQWDSISVPIHRATGATLISYDHQGFGNSTIDTANYNILNEVKSLETGLRKLGYDKKPLIIVSHSLGAFYARVYTSRNANLVKGIIMLDPRIPSPGDIAFARNVTKSLNHATLKKESLAMYYLLINMERTIGFVKGTKLKSKLPILDIMAETGPFELTSDNERFKSDQRTFVMQGSNRTLLYAKGSTHNIPLDQPQLVINEIISFYKMLKIRISTK
jgi:pimeloyl-ACP methyl ester carboxylesterase